MKFLWKNLIAGGVFFTSLTAMANPPISSSDIVSMQNKLDLLNKKMTDGQISPEPNAGPGNTLAEQIQLLEGELIKQSPSSTSMSESPSNLAMYQNQGQIPQTQLSPGQIPQGTPPSQLPSPDHTNNWGQQLPSPNTNQPTASLVTAIEFETMRLHIQGLEARIALMEKQIAFLSQQPRSSMKQGG